MCVESRLCWSRQNGAHEVLAAPAYRPSTSLRWYACNNCEPAAKRSGKQDKKPASSCYSLQVRVAGDASDEDGPIASQCQGAIKNPHSIEEWVPPPFIFLINKHLPSLHLTLEPLTT